jgi:hypothetical protein
MISNSRIVKKPKFTQNIFEITQFKKMLGKGIIKMWKGIIADKKTMERDVTRIKERILSNTSKTAIITGYLNDGVIYIFNGYEKMLAIGNISYADIKKKKIQLDIIVQQYPKLTKAEISKMLL